MQTFADMQEGDRKMGLLQVKLLQSVVVGRVERVPRQLLAMGVYDTRLGKKREWLVHGTS